ncbi:hypothetical protein CXG81DRAFT_7933, partial [Caulochytrium protostelioides]
FSLPIFFIIFRETFEASLIVSILLAFLRRTFGSPGAGAPVYQRAVLKKYTWHIVFGTIAGLAVSMALGLALLYLFYTYSANLWANGGEFLWEGVFCAVSAVVIAVMGVGMMGKGFAVNVVGIRSQPHGSAPTTGSFRERYAFFFMPFLTVLREGLEGMVFIGGVATSESPSAIPGAAVAGAMLGTFLGWILFRTGLKSAASSTAWHVFFLASTACLLLVAAGLVARSVQFLSSYHYALILRANSPNAHLYPSPSAIPLLEPEGLGEFEYDLFDPRDTLWALGFGNPENPANGGWLLANAMLGWFPRGSVRTVAAYMGFWLLMAIG